MKQTDVSISLKSVREIRGASVVNRRAALRAAGKPVQVDMAVRVVPEIHGEPSGYRFLHLCRAVAAGKTHDMLRTGRF